ncbi:hypothetical protein SAMN04488047_1561 [Tranquillimonas alkanivorans]|uniref:Uncharacterized protein n=1 Tax=Tranquillimonas alkanivorans TaxID=441119 RepID=A0A1I5WT89_9RHOB|nr:hypothetical protein SAMN04488047_1561 [Tranquillimonas alkanivorans]
MVDGRERYLLQCSNEAMTVSLRKSGKQASLDKVASLTWELFERSVDNTDGKWSADDAAREARRRLEEFKSGTWTFSGSNKEDILYPVDEPYHKPLVVEREVGLKQLEHHLSAFFSDGEGPKRLALRITMGAGKTHRTIEHLKQSLTSSFNRRVEIYVPYHSLAAEYEQKLLAEGSRVNARVVHVFPRTGGSRGDLPVMCGRADHVRALEEAELPVFKHACRSDTDGESCVQRCPLYDHCGYIQQFADPPIDELNGNVVRIFAHNYLSLPRNPIQRDPDTVIIDEAFVTGLAKAVRVRRAHLSQLIRTVSFPRLGKLIGEALEEGRPVLDVLRDEGVAEVDLRAVEKDIRETLTHVPFGANAVSISNDEIPRRRAVTALRLLREELGLSDRKRAERVTYDPVKDDVVLCVGSEVEVPDDANLLVLDATADEQLLEKAVGPVEFHRIDIRQRAWVTQVYDRTGSNTFWNNNLDEVGNLIRVVNAWAEIGEKPLVVGHKALCDYLREHDGLHAEVIVAHFMSLRGSNAAKECTVAFIAGRNQPPSATVDEMARALFWADDEPLFHDEATQRVQTDRRAKKGGFLPVQLRGFLNAENGPREQHGVMVHAFSDARIEAIHAQMREAETVQAVARLRLVHAEAMKRVFLLSNLPVEIPVHRLCKFDELMPDPLELALLKKGNVPLTPLGLRKMRPDLHPSSEAAKKALQRSVLGREDQLRMLPSLMRSGCVVVRFKARNNNRLKEHKHLFLLHGGEAKQEIPGLSERVGRVPFSEWVEFLRRGDPALPDTGWGEVLDPSMEWLPMMS